MESEHSTSNFSGSGVLFHLNYKSCSAIIHGCPNKLDMQLQNTYAQTKLNAFLTKKLIFFLILKHLLFLHRGETFLSTASNREAATSSWCHKMLFSSGPPRFTLCLNVLGTALAINRVLQTKRKCLSRMTSNWIHNSLRTNKCTELESSALPQQASFFTPFHKIHYYLSFKALSGNCLYIF